jgi:hypothetical protein
MKAQDIYHKMRAIAEDYHAYTDQLTAIAKWIEAEFEYKPQKLANGANTSKRQLTIPNVSKSACIKGFEAKPNYCFECEKENDYEFNLHKHWKDEDRTGFDSKPIGGFSDW